MKNLSQFKKRIQVGIEVETIHAKFGSFGKRKISISQSNSFALETTRTDGTKTDSWIEFPKAKNIEFPDQHTAVIFWGEGNKREKILTYIFDK